MRPRREVSPAILWLLRPFFRHSWTRSAWILRGVGNRRGPVLVRKGTHPTVEGLPDLSEDIGPQRRKFARPRERGGEVDEDRQVRVEPYTIRTEAERK